jgi:hypothetical protein
MVYEEQRGGLLARTISRSGDRVHEERLGIKSEAATTTACGTKRYEMLARTTRAAITRRYDESGR